MSVFVEEWAATYGSPYLVVGEEWMPAAGPGEDGSDLRAHHCTPVSATHGWRSSMACGGSRRRSTRSTTSPAG